MKQNPRSALKSYMYWKLKAHLNPFYVSFIELLKQFIHKTMQIIHISLACFLACVLFGLSSAGHHGHHLGLGGPVGVLLGVGLLAHLLQGDRGHHHHHVHPVFIPIPVHHHGHHHRHALEGHW